MEEKGFYRITVRRTMDCLYGVEADSFMDAVTKVTGTHEYIEVYDMTPVTQGKVVKAQWLLEDQNGEGFPSPPQPTPEEF